MDIRIAGLAAAIHFAVAGCATGHWVKAGGDPQGFTVDSELCTLDSWRATPEPQLQGPPCNSDGSYINCSPRVSEGPARAYPRTQAEMLLLAERDKARRGTYSQCLRERGWRWQQLS
jgi:hypothetical protein